jgi:hypothetical protein
MESDLHRTQLERRGSRSGCEPFDIRVISLAALGHCADVGSRDQPENGVPDRFAFTSLGLHPERAMPRLALGDELRSGVRMIESMTSESSAA